MSRLQAGETVVLVDQTKYEGAWSGPMEFEQYYPNPEGNRVWARHPKMGGGSFDVEEVQRTEVAYDQQA